MTSGKNTPVQFSEVGLSDVCLKHITLGGNDGSFTAKRHFHKSYEMHLIVGGSQTYEIGDTSMSLYENEAVLFSPNNKHRLTGTEFPLEKYAFTFTLDEERIRLPGDPFLVARLTPSLVDFISGIKDERNLGLISSRRVVEGRVLESLIRLLRIFGAEESECAVREGDGDVRLSLAREYIRDNAALGVCVSDVARYCHMSERQLQRIFASDNDSVSRCIRRAKISLAEQMLSDSRLSLPEVAAQSGFADEFYFNACFKKENGMTPGAYRRAFKKS